MIRKNSCLSAESSSDADSSNVAADPLIDVSGARNSWLTMPRNSARSRSSSCSGVRSCNVTTTETTSPPSVRIGVAFISVVTLRPSGTESTISSARIVSALPSTCANGIWSSAISRPSAKRQVITCSSSIAGRPAVRSPSTMRRASRLSDTGWPVRASNTATPTGEVSTRASRSARARRSARWVRALAIDRLV